MIANVSRQGHDRTRDHSNGRHRKEPAALGKQTTFTERGRLPRVYPGEHGDPRLSVQMDSVVDTLRSTVLEKPISATDGGDLNFSFQAATKAGGPCGVILIDIV